MARVVAVGDEPNHLGTEAPDPYGLRYFSILPLALVRWLTAGSRGRRPGYGLVPRVHDSKVSMFGREKWNPKKAIKWWSENDPEVANHLRRLTLAEMTSLERQVGDFMLIQDPFKLWGGVSLLVTLHLKSEPESLGRWDYFVLARIASRLLDTSFAKNPAGPSSDAWDEAQRSFDRGVPMAIEPATRAF